MVQTTRLKQTVQSQFDYMKKGIFLLVALFCIQIQAQEVERVEPPNWWVEMENHKLELLIYGDAIADYTPVISDKNIQIDVVKRTENSNYLFVTVSLENAKAGTFEIQFSKNGKKAKKSYTYTLNERKKDSKYREGFSSKDAIYLITPDRFANGDPSNDVVKGLHEEKIDRSHDYARHGGDLAGITNHLNYISDLGFTAIWPCPVLINDMPQSSYHGYAMTDFYKVDPRFGTMEEYINLSKKGRELGVSLIMDQVANHIGIEHWWMKDLPASDWVNYQENFEKGGDNIGSTHRRTVNQDSYASEFDKKGMSHGWFSGAMPDLNQKNELLATYLIQNSIWWVETLDLSGIRQDTYPYPDKAFMSRWAGAIMTEYPNFNIVGEEWSSNPLLIGYWQSASENRDGYQSNLKSTMDFAMQEQVVRGVNEEEGWEDGLFRLYSALANDFAYSDPFSIVVFPDNHDMSRIHTQVNLDVPKTKMAIGYLMALPRIAQFYYGTEILMHDQAKPGDHGLIRSDFPGGWEGDGVNAFTGEGLTTDQLDMQGFTKAVLNYRKHSEAIHSGKTLHFVPQNGVYVLFRMKGDETVAVILNKNEEAFELDLTRFEQAELQGKQVKNIVTSETLTWGNSMTLSGRGIYMFTTKK